MIIPETYGLWEIDYNPDNWELEFMTIFMTWQLRVTMDSIRNACDVCLKRVQIDQFACEDGQGGRQEHQSSPPRSLQAPARHNLPPEKER